MKIYTRLGDAGETGLLGGVRALKNSPTLNAIGEIDELNAALGLICAEGLPHDIDKVLEQLQNELFGAGAELASVQSVEPRGPRIAQSHVQAIEACIDRYEAKLQPLKGFILPGGVRSAAMFHVARTICRRAERQLVSLTEVDKHAVSAGMLAYINRLSDLLFVLARHCNAEAGVSDIQWKKS